MNKDSSTLWLYGIKESYEIIRLIIAQYTQGRAINHNEQAFTESDHKYCVTKDV